MNIFFSLICFFLMPFIAYGAEDLVHEFEVQSTKFMIPGKAIFCEQPKECPTIFWCHGGPHEPTDENFLKELSQLTEANVVGFDFQGSVVREYKTVAKDPQAHFYNSVDDDYGGGHMDDLKAVVDYATNNFSLNKRKYVIAGHSFGGYMAALAVTDCVLSPLFQLGLLCSGFYDLGEYKTINCPGDGEDEEIKRRRSPLNYTKNISQQIILVHGGKEDQTTLVNLKNAKLFLENAQNETKEIIPIFMEDEKHDYSDEGWYTIGQKVKEALSNLN